MVDAFVVTGDGTNQTAQLRAALQQARDSTTVKTVRVVGTVRVEPTWEQIVDEAGIVAYRGTTLEGAPDGSSIISVLPRNLVDTRVYYVIKHYGETVFRDFQLDGNKTGYPAGSNSWVKHATNGLKGANDSIANVRYENLRIYDLFCIGKDGEGFGILMGDGQTRSIATGCQIYRNNGTGINVTGNPIGAPRGGGGTEIASCRLWLNGWNGISVYGCDDVRLTNCRAWDNGESGYGGGGLNFEWSTRITVSDCLSHDNQLGGITAHGWIDGLAVVDSSLHNNYVGDGIGNEIMVMKARSDTLNQSGPLRVAGRIEFRRYSVTPPPSLGRAHLWYAVANDATDGTSVPDVTLVEMPNLDGWTIQTPREFPNWRAGVNFGVPVANPARLGVLSSEAWEHVGSFNVSPFTEPGARSANPVVLGAGARNARLVSQPVLEPNRTYRVRTRVRVERAGRPWALEFSYAGGLVERAILPLAAVDVGKWFEFDTLVRTPAQALAVRFTNYHDGANALVVDFVQAAEVAPGVSTTADAQAPSGTTDYHVWVDDEGRLRAKRGVPTHAADGVVVDM